jgi:hypothetical protein
MLGIPGRLNMPRWSGADYMAIELLFRRSTLRVSFNSSLRVIVVEFPSLESADRQKIRDVSYIEKKRRSYASEIPVVNPTLFH